MICIHRHPQSYAYWHNEFEKIQYVFFFNRYLYYCIFIHLEHLISDGAIIRYLGYTEKLHGTCSLSQIYLSGSPTKPLILVLVR